MIILIRRKHLYLLAVLFALVALAAGAFFAQQHAAISAWADETEVIYLPIIMYHEIKDSNLGNDAITPQEFEDDLQYLRDHGYHTIGMDQLVAYVYGEGTLPEHPVMLTFDDGYLSTYVQAFPLLKKYEMRMVLSVIGWDLDAYSEVPSNDLNYAKMTWSQLNEMLASGYVEVGNHTYNLHSANRERIGCLQRQSETFEQYEQALAEDIGRFQEQIFAMTGRLPVVFSYPYGACGENTDIILGGLGFKATLSCDYGVNIITRDTPTLFGLQRIRRSHGDVLAKVLKKALATVK